MSYQRESDPAYTHDLAYLAAVAWLRIFDCTTSTHSLLALISCFTQIDIRLKDKLRGKAFCKAILVGLISFLNAKRSSPGPSPFNHSGKKKTMF